VSGAIQSLWQARADRYSETRTINTKGLAPGEKKVEMSYIGG
jgi:cyclic pyranopterin phosphate synthase